MKEEQYIEERVNNQIAWYGKKSATNKKLHFWTRGLVIIFSAIIPFASGFLETGPSYLNYMIGTLGMLVAILTGISSLVKFQEKWVKYRSTSEAIKHEKYMYMTNFGQYHNKEKKFNLFVGRIETLISTENSAWSEIMDKDEE